MADMMIKMLQCNPEDRPRLDTVIEIVESEAKFTENKISEP